MSLFQRLSLVAILVTTIITFLVFSQLQISALISFLIAINVVQVFFFAYDKSIASSNKQRVPEKVFWLLAILGASPALIIAMNLFRHKTKKASFQVIAFAIAAAQIFVYRFF